MIWLFLNNYVVKLKNFTISYWFGGEFTLCRLRKEQKNWCQK